MPNNVKKTIKNKPIVVIGPKTSNTQAFGSYASNKGGAKRSTRKSRARK